MKRVPLLLIFALAALVGRRSSAAHTLRWLFTAWLLQWMCALLQAELGELAALLRLGLGDAACVSGSAVGNHQSVSDHQPVSCSPHIIRDQA